MSSELARHEQPHKPPGHLEQLRMRGEKLPEGPARLQYEDFLRRVDALLADLGFESIEAFVTGAKETEKNLEALPYLMTLLRKLMEINETKERVTDEFEYVVDIEDYEGIDYVEFYAGEMVLSVEEEGDLVTILNQDGEKVVEKVEAVDIKASHAHWYAMYRNKDWVLQLVDRTGKKIAEDFSKVEVVEAEGKTVLYFENGMQPYLVRDSYGRPLYDESRFVCKELVPPSKGFAAVMKDRESGEMFLMDQHGKQIGKRYSVVRRISQKSKIVAMAVRDNQRYYLDITGKEYPVDESIGHSFSAGDALYFSKRINGERCLVDEAGKEFIGPGHIEGKRIEEIVDVHETAMGPFIVVGVVPKDTPISNGQQSRLKRRAIMRMEKFLINPKGEVVNFAGLYSDPQEVVRGIAFHKEVEGEVFFTVRRRDRVRKILVNHEGKPCSNETTEVKVFGKFGDKVLRYEVLTGEVWRVFDQDRKEVMAGADHRIKPIDLFEAGGVLYAKVKRGNQEMIRQVEGSGLIGSGVKAEIYQKEGVYAFVVIREHEHDLVRDLESSLPEVTFAYIEEQKVVGNTLIIRGWKEEVAEGDDELFCLYTHLGEKIEIPGDVRGFEPAGDDAVSVIYLHEGEMHKKVVKI